MKFTMFLLAEIYRNFSNYLKVNVMIDNYISIRYVCVKVVDYYDTHTRLILNSNPSRKYKNYSQIN